MRRSKETLRTMLRTVDGAAARPLADKLAREGTTGRLPAIIRAPLICARLAATGSDPASAEVSRIDRRHCPENMVVVNVRDIREARSAVQWPESTESMEVRDVIYIDHAEPPAVSTPPRMEPVTRSDREPAEAAPTAKANSEAKAAAPSPERNVRGRPERTV